MKPLFLICLFATQFVGVSFSQVQNLSMSPTKDAFIYSDAPSSNGGTLNTLYVGRYSNKGGTTFHTRRSAVHFDLSSIPSNAVVLSAELKLNGLSSATGSPTFQAIRMTSSWAETGITWSNSVSPTNILDPTVSSDFVSQGINKVADVKAQVQQIINGWYANYGWMILLKSGETANYNLNQNFGSKENSNSSLKPILEISYYVPMSVNSVDITHQCSFQNDGSIRPSLQNGPGGTYSYQWYNSNGIMTGETNLVLLDLEYGWYGLKVTSSVSGSSPFFYSFLVGKSGETVSINYNAAEIDPGFVDDATINSLFQQNNVGTNNYIQTNKGNFGTLWFDIKSLLRFRLWLDDEIVINEAELNVKLHQAQEGTRSYPNSAKFLKAIDPWEEMAVNYLNAPNYSGSNFIFVPATGTGTFNTFSQFNALSQFNEWQQNNSLNYGWLFQLEFSNNAAKYQNFYSSDIGTGTDRPFVNFEIKVPTCGFERCDFEIGIVGDGPYCAGNFYNLYPINGNGTSNQGYSFQWAPANLLSCVNCEQTIYTMNESGFVTLTITDPNGQSCPDRRLEIVLGEGCEEVEPESEEFEQLGCIFGNFGAGVVISDGTKLNVYCNIINELALTNNGIEGGQFNNFGEINSTRNWSNNAQNELFNVYQGKTNLIGPVQYLGGTSSIHFNDLALDGTGSKVILLDEFANSTLDLKAIELVAKNSTFHLTNFQPNSLSRTSGFISTDESLGYFNRSLVAGSGPYLYPMGSTQGTFRYRPLEIIDANNNDQFKAHFENTLLTLNTGSLAPNVLSIYNQYYYKFVSTSLSQELGITAYYSPADGSFQAISHYIAGNDNWWAGTPGNSGSSVPSTNTDTYGLKSASTVGSQSFDTENFAFAQAGFYINTEDFGSPDGSNDSDGDGIPDDVDVDNTGGTDLDGDGIDDLVDVDYTGGSDLDGDGIDDSSDPNVGGGTVITVTSPSGSSGGGIGNSSGTGNEGVYTPSPVPGSYVINITPGNCGVAGSISFDVLPSGQIDETTINFHPDGSSNSYLLSKEVYEIDNVNAGLILHSTPKEIIEACANSLIIKFGDASPKYCLDHINPSLLEDIQIINPMYSIPGGLSLTLNIYDQMNNFISPSFTNLTGNISDIQLSPSLAAGIYKFELVLDYFNSGNPITKTIKGQFIIK